MHIRTAAAAVGKWLSIWLLMMLGAQAQGQVLVQDGKPLARIYHPVLPPPPAGARPRRAPPERALAAAARELKLHFQKMSGAQLEIVETDDPRAIRGPAIVLGKLAADLGAVPRATSVSKEGFRLLTSGDRLLIGGESDEAVLFGAYELLEKLGIDWVMPGEIGAIVPKRRTIRLPRVDESQAPDFQMRALHYRGGPRLNSKDETARLAQWLKRKKSGSFRPVANQTRGHYSPRFIKKHKAAFDADPSMYALRRRPDGSLRRQGPQIETTHPRVIELMVSDIKAEFAARKWPRDKAVGFPIGPADGLGFSQSPESLAAGSGRVDPIWGDPDVTDQLVLLGNTILERLGQEYPNVQVGFLSYAAHQLYPLRHKPHPRLVQVFAPIGFSRFHSATDPASRSHAHYRPVVEQWGRLAKAQGNPLLYIGYNWNLAENMLPYSKVRIWGEELPWYHRLGISGVDLEATKAWSVNGPSDWIFMKLAWDSSQDWKALLAEYCRKSFGAGAELMRHYFLRLIERQHGAGQEAGSYHAFHLIYDRAFVAAGRADMAQARRLAADEAEKTRIRHFADNLTALALYLDYFEATTRFDFVAARRAHEAMNVHWQRSYAENGDLVGKEVPQYLERFLGRFVREGALYSTGAYRIVAPLPDALETVLVGAGTRVTRTYSTTWDAQGLAGQFAPVTYRHRFTLPPRLRGQPIGLFLGGFNDEARVSLNGREIGTSGKLFSNPAAFDLTEAVDYRGENVLTIEVIRNHSANEIGVGGLFRPSFLFTGPRLAAPAPKPPPQQRRVLPGGELGEVERQ